MGVSHVLVRLLQISYKLNMAFAAYLLENAMLVVARGVAFAHFVMLHRRVFGETRSATEERCSHNLQSGHPACWSADNCSVFPTVNIFRLFRSKKLTGRGNQKCLKK